MKKAGGPGAGVHLRRLTLVVVSLLLGLGAATGQEAVLAGGVRTAGSPVSGPGRFTDLEHAVAAGALDARAAREIRRGSENVIVSFQGAQALARAVARAPEGRNRSTAIVSATGPAYASLKARALAGLEGVQVVRDYPSLPISLVRVSSSTALLQLLNRPEVAGVGPDRRERAMLAESLPLIRQPQAAGSGYRGQGTSVAVIDTQVDFTRAAFGSCTSPGEPAGCKVVVAKDFAALDNEYRHGTNVAGIVVGVAPRTKILSLDVFYGVSAQDSDILAAIDWVVASQTTYNIVAMNLSLGVKFDYHDTECSESSNPYVAAFANARAVGVLPVVAAGNDAYQDGVFRSGVSRPACTPGAFRVGAVYDTNFGLMPWGGCTDLTTKADKVTCFSQTGPLLSILAPGAWIRAAGINEGGTSQAAPHVAGAAAVLAAANPAAPVGAIEEALEGSGPRITDRRTGVATRRLDLPMALAAVAGASGRLTAVASVSVGSRPTAAAVDETRSRVFVANFLGSTVSMIDGTTNQALQHFTLPLQPIDVAVDPDSGRVYALAGGYYGDGYRIGSGPVALEVLDPGTGGTTEIPLCTAQDGCKPLAVAVDPQTDRVYVRYIYQRIDAGYGTNRLAMVDQATNQVLESVDLFGTWDTSDWDVRPGGLAVDPTHDLVFTCDGSGVSRWDAATLDAKGYVPRGCNDLAVDERSGLLWAAGGDWTDGPLLYALDPVANELVTTVTLVKDPDYTGGNAFAYAVAVNEQTGHVYVTYGYHGWFLAGVDEATFEILDVRKFDGANVAGTQLPGVAVDQATGAIYAVQYGWNALSALAEERPPKIEPSTFQPELLIGFSKTRSEMVGDDVYNVTGSKQARSASVKRGFSKSFYIRLENDGTKKDTIYLQGPGSSNGFVVTYFDVFGGNDATPYIVAGTYRYTNFGPDNFVLIRVVIRVTKRASPDAVKSVLVVARSKGNGSRDAVRAKVTAVRVPIDRS